MLFSLISYGDGENFSFTNAPHSTASTLTLKHDNAQNSWTSFQQLHFPGEGYRIFPSKKSTSQRIGQSLSYSHTHKPYFVCVRIVVVVEKHTTIIKLFLHVSEKFIFMSRTLLLPSILITRPEKFPRNHVVLRAAVSKTNGTNGKSLYSPYHRNYNTYEKGG